MRDADAERHERERCARGGGLRQQALGVEGRADVLLRVCVAQGLRPLFALWVRLVKAEALNVLQATQLF